MERCPHCHVTKALDEFHRSRVRRDGHQSICKSCRSLLSHERYLRTHPSARRTGPRSVEHGRVVWLRSLKAGKPCKDCGRIYPREAMQWDHLPGREKRGDISAFTTGTREDVLAEIAKCELVCTNCHTLRTFRRAGWELREDGASYAA